MGYYVAEGRTITSARGIISGGAEDSEITWKCLCKRQNDPKAVETAKAQIPRLLKCGAIIEADEMPLSPADVADGEARDKITETIPLQRPQSRDGREIGVKGRQAERLSRVQTQSVDLTGDGEPEAETADAGDAPPPAGEKPSGKGGAKRAAKPKGD